MGAPFTSRSATRSGIAAVATDPYQIRTVCTAYPVVVGRRISAADGAALQQALDTANARRYDCPSARGDVSPHGVRRELRAEEPRDSAGAVGGDSLGQHSVRRGGRAARRHARDRGECCAHAADPRQQDQRSGVQSGAAGPWLSLLVGLDIGIEASVQQLTNLVELGNGADVSVDTEPSDIVIDRSYLHGNDTGNYRRGVLLNGANLAVIDSTLANFHDANGDSQALGGSNGPGPFKIVNNLWRPPAKMSCSADRIRRPEPRPSDIEVSRNLSTKRTSWQDAHIPVKNAFELKNARRVLVQATRSSTSGGLVRTARHPVEVRESGRTLSMVRDRIRHLPRQHRAQRGSRPHHRCGGNRPQRCAGAPAGQPYPDRERAFEALGPAAKLLRIIGGVSNVDYPNNLADQCRRRLQRANTSNLNPNFTSS